MIHIMNLKSKQKLFDVCFDEQDDSSSQTQQKTKELYNIKENHLRSPIKFIDMTIEKNLFQTNQQTQAEYIQDKREKQTRQINLIKNDVKDQQNKEQLEQQLVVQSNQQSKQQQVSIQPYQEDLGLVLFHTDKKKLKIELESESGSENSSEKKKQQNSNSQNEDQNPSKQQKRKNKVQNLFKIHYKEIKDFYKFLTSEIDKDRVLLTSVKRYQFGFNLFWPQFELLFSQNYSFGLFAKKMMGSTSSNFYISTTKNEVEPTSSQFVAKLRSNSSENKYSVYDSGINPSSNQSDNGKKVRQLQATIVFKTLQNENSPRDIIAYILKENYQYKELEPKNKPAQQGLDELFQIQENKKGIHMFKTRRPIYSNVISGYILNFSGRVNKPSVKNFILQDQSEKQVIMMGKTDQNIYRLDITHPIKPYIALSICLANFDSKYTGS